VIPALRSQEEVQKVVQVASRRRQPHEEGQNEIFTDATEAREWLEAELWPHGPACPLCGARGAGGHLQFPPDPVSVQSWIGRVSQIAKRELAASPTLPKLPTDGEAGSSTPLRLDHWRT
jgi:hypothetical protein